MLSTAHHEDVPGSRHGALLALALAMLGCLVYFNSLANPFVYDDYRLIVENTALTHPSDLRAVIWHDVTRPVVGLSYALDASLWGVRPLGFHLTNVLLHAINVLLVFLLAWTACGDGTRRGTFAGKSEGAESTDAALGARQAVAGLTAGVFAVHPLLSQVVGYASARSELLCATFVLLACLTARRFLLGGGSRPWAVATFVFWLCGLGAKEVAAMLPFALLVYGAVFLRPASVRRLTLLLVPMLAVVAIAGVARVWILVSVEYRHDPLDWHLGLVAMDAWRRYAQLLVWPSGQTIFHAVSPIHTAWDTRVLLTASLLTALAAFAWRLRREHPLVPFGLMWFGLFLLPSSILFALGRGEALAEHRVYLSSLGVFLAGAALLVALLERLEHAAPVLRGVIVGAVPVVGLLLAGRTIVRNAVWSDDVGLWRESIELAPDHWLPRLMLGEALRIRSGCAAAEPEYRRSLALNPREPVSYVKLGGCLVEQHRLDDAQTVYAALEQIAPAAWEGPMGLAIVALLRGGPDLSREHLRDAIRRDPSAVQPRQLLAALEEPRDPAEALRQCLEIRRLAPGTPGNEDCIERNRRERDTALTSRGWPPHTSPITR